MSSGNQKGLSWGWVVFWIIIFWPVGVFLLIRKLTTDKSAAMTSERPLSIAALVLMTLGIIYIILSFADQSMLLAAAVFGIPGIWLFFKSKQTKAAGAKYRKYIAIVINQNQTSIDNIASAMGVKYEQAAKDLQKMINAGYFTGAYIDVTQREIVLARVAPPQTAQDFAIAQSSTIVVSCNSCGANNQVIHGRTSECEYCGSPIQSNT